MASLYSASLGTFTFNRMGGFQPATEKAEIVTRPNVVGTAVARTQPKPGLQEYLAEVDFVAANAAALAAKITAWAALPGHVMTYTDDLGLTHNVTVQAMDIKPEEGNRANPHVLGPSSGGQENGAGTHFITLRIWMIENT